MTPEEYDAIQKLSAPVRTVLSGRDLDNREDRTLLFGYSGRRVHHVYIKNGTIFCIQYCNKNCIGLITVTCNELYVPSFGIHPAWSDFEFCRKLRLAGEVLETTGPYVWKVRQHLRKPQLVAGCYFGEIINHEDR